MNDARSRGVERALLVRWPDCPGLGDGIGIPAARCRRPGRLATARRAIRARLARRKRRFCAGFVAVKSRTRGRDGGCVPRVHLIGAAGGNMKVLTVYAHRNPRSFCRAVPRRHVRRSVAGSSRGGWVDATRVGSFGRCGPAASRCGPTCRCPTRPGSRSRTTAIGSSSAASRSRAASTRSVARRSATSSDPPCSRCWRARARP